MEAGQEITLSQHLIFMYLARINAFPPAQVRGSGALTGTPTLLPGAEWWPQSGRGSAVSEESLGQRGEVAPKSQRGPCK